MAVSVSIVSATLVRNQPTADRALHDNPEWSRV